MSRTQPLPLWLILPWWVSPCPALATALETALSAGEEVVEFGQQRLSVERIADMAQQAIEMVERLEAEASALTTYHTDCAA